MSASHRHLHRRAADKKTWVRIFQPPIEGRLLYGAEGVDVGHRLKVQLVRTDVEKGYIDFKKVEQNLLERNSPPDNKLLTASHPPYAGCPEVRV